MNFQKIYIKSETAFAKYLAEWAEKMNIEVDDTAARIQIIDNGIGIAKSALPNIFDMFYRASDISDGSGLGLYIVKEMVEKLGGEISVTSQINQGSSFIIKLPVR